MKIGLPNALLYHNYKYLWKDFFNRLGHEVVVSPPTTKQILNNGLALSVDECCLSFKIFMGHVAYLMGRCDFVLVPRLDSFGKGERVCVKFNGLCDIVRNTLSVPVLDYDVDVLRGKTERQGFLKMGRLLGHGRKKTLHAYKNARRLLDFADAADAQGQAAALKKGGTKILLVGHPYNCLDPLVGQPIVDFLKDLGVEVIYAHKFCAQGCAAAAAKSCPTLYWSFSKHLVGAVELFKQQVDGIIFLSTFPCGPDSLINELMIRRLSGTRVCNIIVDELQGENGLHTRLESFLDIVTQGGRLCKK